MIIIAGVSFRPNADWNIEMNVDWTDWDVVNDSTFKRAFGGDQVSQFRYDSSFMYNFGITRKLPRGYFASGEYVYIDNSVPSSSFPPLTPDAILLVGSLAGIAMLKSIDSAPDTGTVVNRPGVMTRAQEFPTAATELPLPVKALSPQPGVENRSDERATHIAGTIAAAGILPSARGMANAAGIHSDDWLNDRSEMLARGASYPAEPGRIAISNHSYGILSGWQTTGQRSPAWRWHGSGTGSPGMEGNFGKYGNAARDVDALAHSLPYDLVFRSAGNDRNDDPAAGDPVAVSGSTVSYNPANHPAGDGVYRGGYDTLSPEAVGKNVITIGAVNDAVNGGLRDTTRATITSFSSWGPTDDGRIKPDLVANGATVYSALGGSDTSYGVYSGTSMAAPNASGTAQQLVDYYQQLHPGQALRASTLKALLIHSADDLGRPGPDYQFGWGLINGHAAAAKLRSHHQSPATREVVESRLTSTRASHTEALFWDGLSPIRATLAWNDPAASMVFGNDSRTPRLVNDLDLRIVGPDGSEHFPFVMPFVGNWSSASFSSPATTGVNRTDNVEQVLIAKPPVAGVYTVSVTFSGTLTGSAQAFSLILSGAATGPELGERFHEDPRPRRPDAHRGKSPPWCPDLPQPQRPAGGDGR